MFRARHRLHRLHRLNGLQQVVGFADDIHAHGPWRYFGSRRQSVRGPSLGLILLAGLAVFAFLKLTAAADRPNRSTLEKIALAALALLAGAFLLSLVRSARRYRR
jgi:hypothetical protein